MKVFRITETAKLPQKTDEDMCYDLFADLTDPISVGPNHVAVVPINIKIDFGEYDASLRPRSGLARNHGLQVLGGQLDRSYRGNIEVMLTSIHPVIIGPGTKVVQMKLEKHITDEVIEVSSEDELSDSHRGESGFGSTGI